MFLLSHLYMEQVMCGRLHITSAVSLRALKPYLIIYQVLGLIPTNANVLLPTALLSCRKRLRWHFGWARIYSAAVLLLVTCFLVTNLPSLDLLVFRTNGDVVSLLEAANRLSVYLNVFVTFVMCFCYLGSRICRLIDKMMDCERDLIQLDCHLENSLTSHCWIVSVISIAFTLLNEIVFNFKYLKNFTAPQCIFHVATNLIAAVFWIFIDLSIIQMSLIFSCYERQLRKEIDRWSLSGLKAKEHIRLTYWKIQRLVKEADEIFSPGVLIGSLSCVAHLILLVNILIGWANRYESNFDESEKIYILLSTTFTTVYLALRFVATSLYAEKIHREKLNSLRSLYKQSGQEFWSYDLELLITKRFVHQLTLPLGFTGCGFFTLGKRYLLAMCGTMLTYEIVLMDMTKTDRLGPLDPATVNNHSNAFP